MVEITTPGLDSALILEVRFNGALSPGGMGVVGKDYLWATVPTNATSGPISLVTKAGTFTTADPFIVLLRGAPVLSSFSPGSGSSGSTVWISGTDLVDVISVKIGGVEAGFFGSLGDINTIEAIIPIAANTGPITVTTTRGSFTTKESFVVLPDPPPHIGDISPSIGEPGAKVSIFLPDRNAFALRRLLQITNVQFNGVSAQFRVDPNALPLQIEATVPPRATTGPITVFGPTGSAVSSTAFTVVPPPVMAGFDPTEGPPGSVVKVAGTNFSRITKVLLGDTTVPFTKTPGALSFTVGSNAVSGPISLLTDAIRVTTSRNFKVTRNSDLVVSGAADWGQASLPTSITFSISVRNVGGTVVHHIILTNVFGREPFIHWLSASKTEPAQTLSGFRLVSVQSSQGSWLATNNTVTCDVGDLPGKSTATAQITVQSDVAGAIYISSVARSNDTDPELDDNQTVSWRMVQPIARPVGLNIRQSGSQEVELFWPSADTNSILEVADRPAEWHAVPGTLEPTNGWHFFRQSTDVTNRFYRLIKPSQKYLKFLSPGDF